MTTTTSIAGTNNNNNHNNNNDNHNNHPQNNNNNNHNEQQPQTPPVAVAVDESQKYQLKYLYDFAKYVPLRLSQQERALLEVLEQTLHVSEYTDHVDVTSSRRGGAVKTRRILDGIFEACHISTGLAVASSHEQSFLQIAAACNTTTENPEEPSNTSPSSTKKQGLFQKKKKSALKLKRKSSSKKQKEPAVAETSQQSSSSSSSSSSSMASRTPKENAQLFQTMFEIGRRNKVLNPSSMRTSYGKLMYLLQDAQNPNVAKTLGFSLYKDLLLVVPYLEQHGCLALLQDVRILQATKFIQDRNPTTGVKYSRQVVQDLVSEKARYMTELMQEYGCDDNDNDNDSSTVTGDNNSETTKQQQTTKQLSQEDIRRVIESIADAISYVESNVRPVTKMLQYLEKHFDPQTPQPPFSLEIKGSGGGSSSNNDIAGYRYNTYGVSAFSSGGGGSSFSDGPKLSHSHSTQYTFVWQSLRLWQKVMTHMHKLWICADHDLLSTSCTYHLYNTGQGLQRVQNCPRVRRIMTLLLQETQTETAIKIPKRVIIPSSSSPSLAGLSMKTDPTTASSSTTSTSTSAACSAWVGLSVIHLGDRDVPNALIFIDKYTQIPRFLNPITTFLEFLEDAACSTDKIFQNYVTSQFGSLQELKMTVLCDYFKHGFDGSGDDGGSCIDGRLTSSWNWTSKVAKKPYYHAFMLTGFQGFDGNFK